MSDWTKNIVVEMATGERVEDEKDEPEKVIIKQEDDVNCYMEQYDLHT